MELRKTAYIFKGKMCQVMPEARTRANMRQSQGEPDSSNAPQLKVLPGVKIDDFYFYLQIL
jgi:hypothetical protein